MSFEVLVMSTKSELSEDLVVFRFAAKKSYQIARESSGTLVVPKN